MKGIILAGGAGTRLHPITLGVSKQLLPVYDKPMIYYPLSILMLAGIREILIITTPHDKYAFENLLKDGKQLGINIDYCIQPEPKGIAEAFILGKDFIGNESVCLILGDNIFYGDGLKRYLKNGITNAQENYSTIFGYYVKDPQRYGVIEFNELEEVERIVEKPQFTKSNYAATGLYFYPNNVVEMCQSLTPSKRGELEITSLNQEYLKVKKLKTELLGRGYLWLDTGTHDALNGASNIIKEIQDRQGTKIGCIEEIALFNQWITYEQLVSKMPHYNNLKNPYFSYIYELSCSKNL